MIDYIDKLKICHYMKNNFFGNYLKLIEKKFNRLNL